MKEKDLGVHVVKYLKETYPEWKIGQEIRPAKGAGSPIADIVMVSPGNEVWVVELKMRLNMTVIYQAARWPVHYRSVAVIKPKKRTDKINWWIWHIHYSLGIGTMLVNPSTGRVCEKNNPKENDGWLDTNGAVPSFVEIIRSEKAKGFSEAGTKGGGYWTPYKETMKSVRNYVQNNPGCGAGDIVNALGKMHYANKHSARTNLVKQLNELEQDWCEVVRKGTYDTFYVKEKRTEIK